MTQEKCTPVCIASPVRRSGTTLVQRLLCSSPDALIYGESCANDFQMLLNVFTNKQMLLRQHKTWYNDQIQSVLAGNVNTWIPDLMPEIDGYLDSFKTMVFSLFNHYQSFANQQGRQHWGMKMPEWNPSSLVLLQQALPSAKIIYIHRNLKDCVRSAKKIDMIREPNEIQHFCQVWKQNGDYARQNLNGDNVLHLDYEDLVSNPVQSITEIERFTGIANIDRKVMNVKTNTYSNDPKLNSENGAYLEPAILTEMELEIVTTFQKMF